MAELYPLIVAIDRFLSKSERKNLQHSLKKLNVDRTPYWYTIYENLPVWNRKYIEWRVRGILL